VVWTVSMGCVVAQMAATVSSRCQSASNFRLFQVLCDQTEVEWVALNIR